MILNKHMLIGKIKLVNFGKGGRLKTGSFAQLMLALIVAGICLFWLPLTFQVFYRRKNNNDIFECNLFLTSYWKIAHFIIPKINFDLSIFHDSVLDLETKMPEGLGKIDKQHIQVKKPRKILRDILPKIKVIEKITKILVKINKKLFKKIVCKKLVWQTEFGLGDAALTAISSGLLWSFKGKSYSNIRRNVNVSFRRPVLEVKPSFSAQVFNVNFKCIFIVQLGHAIFALIKFCIMMLLAKKRGYVKLE
ncbi:DUF2953 domain-containing protein [Bacillota bacterium LX-D]|nr:DUF2953 domain-containing protein [Bacillota bacterium LX-D]